MSVFIETSSCCCSWNVAAVGTSGGGAWTRHVSLSAVTTSFECRNFCSFLINRSKEKMNLSFVNLRQSAEEQQGDFSLDVLANLLNNANERLCLCGLGENPAGHFVFSLCWREKWVAWRTPNECLSFAFKNKLCFSAAPTNFFPTKCRGAEMSQSASADESWLCPMTRLRGQRLGRGDVTLHLHHHGDTSFPHPTWAGWRLRNVLMAFLTAWPGADSRWLRVSTGF